jgi:hypothetical protein
MKRGTPDHPKTLELAQLLEIPQPFAVGILEMLWHYTAKYAPAGDVGRWSDASIAKGIGWVGDHALLVRSLCAAGWLDERSDVRLFVHDWPEHADDAVHTALCRSLKAFADGSEPSDKRLSRKERASLAKRRTACALDVRTKSAQPSPAVAVALPLPEPEPVRDGSAAAVAPPPTAPRPAPVIGDPKREAYGGMVWRAYVDRRGSELPLAGPTDWNVIDRWYRDQIPIRVVLRGFRECNGKNAHALAYYDPAVREAFASNQKALRGA